MSHACHRFSKSYKTLVMFCSLLTSCTISCACHAKRHLSLQKWCEPLVFFNILTWKCASRLNGVLFFDILTSKSGPNVCVLCIFASKCASRHNACTFSTSQLPKVVWTWSFVLRLPRKMHLCRSSSDVPCLPSLFEMLQNLHVLLTFDKLHNLLRLPRETTSEPPKVVRTPSVFNILTWKCVRATTACTFSTS